MAKSTSLQLGIVVSIVTCHLGGPSSSPCPTKHFFQKKLPRFQNHFANYVISANFWAGKFANSRAGPMCFKWVVEQFLSCLLLLLFSNFWPKIVKSEPVLKYNRTFDDISDKYVYLLPICSTITSYLKVNQSVRFQ